MHICLCVCPAMGSRRVVLAAWLEIRERLPGVGNDTAKGFDVDGSAAAARIPRFQLSFGF